MDERQQITTIAEPASTATARSQLRYPPRQESAHEPARKDAPVATQLSAMVSLFGHSKARLLAALEQPATTTALAQHMHTTPSAVSQQLHRLLNADLVSQKRRGREVFYQLNTRGRDLVQLFRY